MPGKLPYVATKGAIEAFTVTLAAEVASRGITVNAVDPGPTDTGWLSADPDLKRTLEQQAPFGRIGQPEDAACLIAFLVSDAVKRRALRSLERLGHDVSLQEKGAIA